MGNSDAFPFFDWVANALYTLYTMLYTGFGFLFETLARIAEILVYPFEATAERFVQFAGWAFGIALPQLLGGVMQPALDYLKDLITWGWSQFSTVLGAILLWLDSLLPPGFSLNLSAVWLVVGYFRAVAWLIDVPFILAAVTFGLTTVWTLQLLKILWRCIPTVG